MNPTTITLDEVIGLDGTPVAETPADTADRMSRLADELAATVNRAAGALAWQETSLATTTGATQDDQDRLDAARQVAARAARALHLVLDCLGELHVTGDQLAHDLHTTGSIR